MTPRSQAFRDSTSAAYLVARPRVRGRARYRDNAEGGRQSRRGENRTGRRLRRARHGRPDPQPRRVSPSGMNPLVLFVAWLRASDIGSATVLAQHVH